LNKTHKNLLLKEFHIFTILETIMPTYEYECKSCSHSFEVFQSMSDPPIKDCPECGKEVRRLIFGGTGVIFKGSGFYVTDKGKGSGKTETKSAASQKPESGQSGDSGSKTGSTGSEIPNGDSAKSVPAKGDAQGSTEKSKSESKSA